VGGITEVYVCHLLWEGRHSIFRFRWGVGICPVAASAWAGHGGPGDW